MYRTPRHSVSTVSSNDSGSRHNVWDALNSTSPTTPFTTPPSSAISAKSDDAAGALLFDPPVAVAFTKGTALFKLKFARIDVCKDAAGGLRRLELASDAQKRETVFYLSFPNSRLPIPHMEQPYEPSSTTYRVSFLEEQTVQTGNNLFQAKPSLAFERWNDCLRFQEALLGQQVIFTAGMAEAKSKGRGEECISQNLRILRPRGTEKAIMIFFANSQRKENRKYVSIPVSSVDHAEVSKKGKVVLKLRADTELMANLKTLQIQFLNDADGLRFAHFVKR
jgi:hypothetical protein